MTAQIRLSVAALVRDGLVLLVHRHPSRRWYADCWDLVGGHVEPNELPHRAVARECLEELGVRVHGPQPIPMRVSDPTLDMHAFLVTRWGRRSLMAEPQVRSVMGHRDGLDDVGAEGVPPAHGDDFPRRAPRSYRATVRPDSIGFRESS